MIWVLFLLIAVVIIAAVAAMISGRLPFDSMSEPVDTTAVIELPRSFGADDLGGVRFDTALRGYRMDQVDQVLEQCRRRLQQLEAELGSRRR